MKKSAAVLATGAVLAAVVAAPAHADRPSAGSGSEPRQSSTVTPSNLSARSGVNQIGLSTTEWKGIQRWLRSQYGYTGAIDGLAGNSTWKAMQRYLTRWYQYSGSIDGIAGTNTIKALQRCLSEGTYGGPIDGIVGPATVASMKVFAAKFA